MPEKMNVYQKLQLARVELQDLNLKKSGQNDFSHYSYYELGDFLPAINTLCKKHGLATVFSIINEDFKSGETLQLKEVAHLTIINLEDNEDFIVFRSPTAEVEIGKKKDNSGGAQPIQNLGGKITYLRRYMLMTAFEMVESDIVEQISKQLAEDVDPGDLKLIEDSKTEEELVKVYKELQKTYKLKLLVPHFKKRKEEIKQEASEA